MILSSGGTINFYIEKKKGNVTLLLVCIDSYEPVEVCLGPPLSMVLHADIWSELQFSTPGDLSDTGIEPVSCVSCFLAGGFFTTATWEAVCIQ